MYNLENFLMLLATELDFNLSNFTSAGILRMAFDPYYHVLGNFTWGVILGFIGVGIYANERSVGTTMTYLIVVGIFFSIIFPGVLAYIFGLMLTFLITITLYTTFVKQRTD